MPENELFLRECKERYNKLFIKKLFYFPKFEHLSKSGNASESGIHIARFGKLVYAKASSQSGFIPKAFSPTNSVYQTAAGSDC
jgi:hypothetical protein